MKYHLMNLKIGKHLLNKDYIMKNQVSIIFIFFILATSFTLGVSDKEYTDQEIEKINMKIELLEEKIQSSEDQLSDLIMILAKDHKILKNKISNLENSLEEKNILISNIGKTTGKTKRNVFITFIMIFIIVVIIIAFLAFIFWPAKTPKMTNLASDASTQLKCPKCGWEHAPGETTCRNCGLKF